ncbi:MAG: hypothetical protein ABI134_36405 [Byssovorax sp.]
MITRSELLDVVYRFYPRGVQPYARIHLPPNEPFYDDTEEYCRLVEAANRGRAEYPTWKAMIGRLGDRYGLQNESIHLLAGGVGPGYSARIYRPKDLEPVPSFRSRASLSFHVSLLGPYYGIHDMGEPDEKPAAMSKTNAMLARTRPRPRAAQARAPGSVCLFRRSEAGRARPALPPPRRHGGCVSGGSARHRLPGPRRSQRTFDLVRHV